MTIPSDPLGRWWVELSSKNPDMVNMLRPSLISFLAFDRSKSPGLAGTGFLLAATPNVAIIVTAKHVLDGVRQIQQPREMHHPSSPFISSSSIKPTLSSNKIRAVWMGDKKAELLDVVYTHYSESLDIAVCIVTPQESATIDEISIPMSTMVPVVGDEVSMVSLGEMGVSETEPISGQDRLRQKISISRSVSIRAGVVTKVFPEGYRQYKWPCFTTSIPADPGMSGGFVTIAKADSTIAACGVVCADNSTDDARTDVSICGESVIGTIWPALALQLPDEIPCTEDTPRLTLFDLIKLNRIPATVGGIDQFELTALGHGNFRISLNNR